MPRIVAREQITSASSKAKNGTPKVYTITVMDDGTGVCTCPDYIIRGVNDPAGQVGDRIVYRCKHLRQVFEKLGGAPTPTAEPQKPAPASGPPNRGSGLGLDDLDLTRRGRRARRDLSL